MSDHYGYSIGPKGRIVHVGHGLKRTCDAARLALQETGRENETAHIYRQADGYRFVGYVNLDGRFSDMRVQR